MHRSIAFLVFLLGFLTQATSFIHRELSMTSKTSLESSTNSTDALGNSKKNDAKTNTAKNSTMLVTDDDDGYVTSKDDDSDTISTHPRKPKKSNSTVIIPGQQETDYVNTSISQWDITNKSMISMNHSISNSTKFLPRERPQSTGWIQSCLGIFLGFAVILFGLTAHKKYRKRMHYEDAPEMQSLVV